jgi:hypothetical protein
MPGYGCYHIGIKSSEEVLADQEPPLIPAVDVE